MSKITSVKVKGDSGYTEIPIGLNTTLISDNSDLNDITDVGWYRATTTTAGTLTNCPVTGGFYMEVKQTRTVDSIYQHIVTYSATNSKHYQRNSNGGSWGDWQEWKLTDTTYEAATTSVAGLMSAADKTKLDGVATGAEVNVQANWNETDTTADSYILNKPFTTISKSITLSSTDPILIPDAADIKVVKLIGTRSIPYTYSTHHGNSSITLNSGRTTSVSSIERFSSCDFEQSTPGDESLYFYAGTFNGITGEVTDTWTAIDLGLKTWSESSYSVDGKHIYYITLSGREMGTSVYGICNGFTFYGNGTSSIANNIADKEFAYRSTNTTIFFRDDSCTTAAAFKTAMSGVYLIYELEEPSTRQLSYPYVSPIKLLKGQQYLSLRSNPVGIGDLQVEIEYITEPFQPLIDALS